MANILSNLSIVQTIRGLFDGLGGGALGGGGLGGGLPRLPATGRPGNARSRFDGGAGAGTVGNFAIGATNNTFVGINGAPFGAALGGEDDRRVLVGLTDGQDRMQALVALQLEGSPSTQSSAP